MANDALTFDAAYCGAVEGMLNGAWNTDTTSADYNAISAAANAFATEFDALLHTNGGVGSNTNRGFLAYAVAKSAFQNRNPATIVAPTTAATYVAIGNACVIQYVNAVANLA